MSEQIKEHEEQVVEAQEVQSEDVSTPAEPTPSMTKNKFTKKKKVTLLAIVAAIAIIAVLLLIPSKFERVKSKCVDIAGMVSGSGDYFTIDTYPSEAYGKDLDPTLKALLLQGKDESALEAIRYANEALGFNGSVYSKMLETSALMGRQSAETDKYEVSWTYHPDDGLEVTYEKK